MNPTPCPQTDAAWARLKTVIDPELGMNLVDLGLVYSVEFKDGALAVAVTLTTRGCPMHAMIVEGCRRALEGIPGVREARVEVVWDPPWNPARMSEDARAKMGR
jgi:metal-sulfur cluster biosynthetic enzyme